MSETRRTYVAEFTELHNIAADIDQRLRAMHATLGPRDADDPEYHVADGVGLMRHLTIMRIKDMAVSIAELCETAIETEEGLIDIADDEHAWGLYAQFVSAASEVMGLTNDDTVKPGPAVGE